MWLFQIYDAKECERIVLDALKSGYRLIDTAAYQNEAAVGSALKKYGLPREEIFVTTKLWVQDASYEGAKKALRTSLDKLGLDYVDLYLVHQPMGDYHGAYRAMEEMYREGLTRAIGTANFYPAVLADLCETVNVIPAVNQVELHPFFAQEAALENMRYYKVQPQAWGSLAEGKLGIFVNQTLTKIGAKYGKSAAQVALRWNVQRGVSVLPKAIREEHIKQNIDIWDFVLTTEEMNIISKLDLGHSEIVDYSDPALVRTFHTWRLHI